MMEFGELFKKMYVKWCMVRFLEIFEETVCQIGQSGVVWGHMEETVYVMVKFDWI